MHWQPPIWRFRSKILGSPTWKGTNMTRLKPDPDVVGHPEGDEDAISRTKEYIDYFLNIPEFLEDKHQDCGE